MRFLEHVVAELHLAHASVLALRAETLTSRFDVCTSRAFAPATQAWSIAEPLLLPEGSLIYWAGDSFDPATLPGSVTAQHFLTPELARSGPLVMMSRQ